MTFFGPEIGSGFGEPDGKSLPRIPRSTILPHPPTYPPTHPKSKSCHIASFLLFYGNPKVFSFLKRDLACTENSPPKKPLFNVSNKDFQYCFKQSDEEC